MTPDVVRTPPRWAERLLRWSLAPDERAAVLGDVQEEFGAITDQSPTRAARWYWRQTLASVIPNIARQIRNQWAEARQVVDEADRRGRRRRLIGGIVWTAFIAIVFGTLAAVYRRHTWDWLAEGAVFASPGPLLMIASRYRAGPGSRQSRRWRISMAVYFPAQALILTHVMPAALESAVRVLWMSVGLFCWMWPRAMWPFRRAVSVRGYSLRSPVVTYRMKDSDVYSTVTVGPEPWSMSPTIVGSTNHLPIAEECRADGVVPMLSSAIRTFTSSDSIRLFSVVNAKPDGLHGALEIRRATTNRVIATIPATVTLATPKLPFRSPYPTDTDAEPPLLPRSPMSELDVTASLAGLTPGQYIFRLSATSDEGHAVQDTEITIWARGRDTW